MVSALREAQDELGKIAQILLARLRKARRRSARQEIEAGGLMERAVSEYYAILAEVKQIAYKLKRRK